MKKKAILLITQTDWTEKLGAAKVHIELKQEYEKIGYHVDKLSFEDLYPNGQSAFDKIFGEFYISKIHKFLKKNARHYDIIDANIHCIIHPKNKYDFKGIVLVRSHGIGPIYRHAEQHIERYRHTLKAFDKKPKLKTRIGNLYRKLQKKVNENDFNLSIQHADIVHCLNYDEYKYYLNAGVAKRKLFVIPNGIGDKFIEECNDRIVTKKENVLSFVGSWTLRKGVKDLSEILNKLDQKGGVSKLMLVGGFTLEEEILRDFSDEQKQKLEVIPTYDSKSLISILNRAYIGVFPSYVEGFPLAIIEQLACGIPIVAYRVPGPKDILAELDNELLVEPGNIEEFVYKAKRLLEMKNEDYLLLSANCKAISLNYKLSSIAAEFIDVYNTFSDDKKGN
ncbi:glycosyltransferase family 4 protein [Pedobacter frigiditerrae]|uniref:glycosyltransferase family 4 protein n=1 Tax=Pedobacter frigiditerrae TaxID=2530452 RepID=UPI00292CD768|nr:glycosyltransferase family 4 protein [Pedobacter frigiditerrae]